MPRKPRFFVILMVIVLCAVAAGLPLAAGKAEPTSQDPSSTSDLPAGDIRSFHLVSADEGWLLLGEDLYWTADGGSTWQKITPPATGQARIRAVTFLDAQFGWAMLTAEGATGFPVYQLAQTVDRGATWQTFTMSLFDPGDVSALAQSVYLDFINPGTGWLVVKQASGGSFSLGALFKTVDGGRTWLRLPIPIGEPVYFINDDVGWVAGGAAGSELYRTQDGGLTWSAQILPVPADVNHLYWLPSFKNAQEGILPAATNTASGSQVDFYTTQDGGQTWEPEASIALGQSLAPGTQPALSMLDGSGWIMLEEDHQQVLRFENGVQTNLTTAPGALPGRITGLDMVNPNVGWAQTAAGDCQPAPGVPGALACTSEAGLLKTKDGGQTWTPLALPQTPGDITPQSNTPTVTGHGWDTCAMPGSSLMQAWMDHSPYRIWNLYIGGSRLAGCGHLTAAYISQLTGQGWKFIPTWVGPQAPCWDNNSLDMSYDPATAYIQGVNEANAAVERAANLQLTKPDKTGAIIYYDLEAFDSSQTTCRNAVKSFMDGWTAQLHARGDQAAVYGLGCNLSDFAANANVPDGIWAAQWPSPPYQFNSNATVWDIHCLSNSAWSSHQRLHQYAGGHNETWGAITMNIDSTVADGIVLDLNAGPRIHFTSPADNAWLPSAGQITVTVAPDDPNASISHVDFQWHSANWTGSNWVTLGSGTQTSNGWSIPFSASGYPEGQGGALYAWAYDSAGNRFGAGAWNLGVDRTPPTVSVTTAPMYGNAPFRDFHVRWSGTDNLSGNVLYDIQYKDSINGSWTNLVTATPDTETTFVGFNGHTYYFRGRGLDASGNLGAYSSNDVHFTVQTCSLSPDGYEADNTWASAKVITVDGPAQAHNFDAEGDQDWVRFDAASLTGYILQTSNTGGNSDTVLYLYGPDHTTLLAVNDDYTGLHLASRIDWPSFIASTYYVKVVHWDPYAAGCTTQYTLSVNHVHFTLTLIMLPMISR